MTKGEHIDGLLKQAAQAAEDQAKAAAHAEEEARQRALITLMQEALKRYSKRPATIGDVANLLAAYERRTNARLERIELQIRALQQATGRVTGQMLRAVSHPGQRTMNEVLDEVDFKRPTASSVCGQGG